VHPTECVLAHDVHLAAVAAACSRRFAVLRTGRGQSLVTPTVSNNVDFQLSLESEGVGSAYPDQPLAASADDSVGSVMQLLRAQRTGAVLICEGSKLVGIVSERDALKQMASTDDYSTPVREIMSSPPATIASSATLGEAIRKMSEGGFRHLPIVDSEQKPTGVLAVNGIMHYLVDHFPETVYNLPPDPKAVTREREGA
jgi:CBS domain-containing protein